MSYTGKFLLAPSGLALQRSPLGALLKWPAVTMDMAFMGIGSFTANTLLVDGTWYRMPADITAQVPIFANPIYVVNEHNIAMEFEVLDANEVQLNKYQLTHTDYGITAELLATTTIDNYFEASNPQSYVPIHHVHVSSSGDITIHAFSIAGGSTYQRLQVLTFSNDLNTLRSATSAVSPYGQRFVIDLVNDNGQIALMDFIDDTDPQRYRVTAMGQDGQTAWSVEFDDPTAPESIRQLYYRQVIWDRQGDSIYVLFTSISQTFWLGKCTAAGLDVVIDYQQPVEYRLQPNFIFEVNNGRQVCYSDSTYQLFTATTVDDQEVIDTMPHYWTGSIHALSNMYAMTGNTILDRTSWTVVKNLSDFDYGTIPLSWFHADNHNMSVREGFIDGLVA